jgi:hypothetical protein
MNSIVASLSALKAAFLQGSRPAAIAQYEMVRWAGQVLENPVILALTHVQDDEWVGCSLIEYRAFPRGSYLELRVKDGPEIIRLYPDRLALEQAN